MTTIAPPEAKLRASITKGRPGWYWPAIIGGSILVIATVRVLTGANDIDSSGALAAAIGLAMPLALAGLGGLWSERAGVVNIAIEGQLLGGAFTAAIVASMTDNPYLGLLAAAVGLLVRHTAAALSIVLGLVFVVGNMVFLLPGAWGEWIGKLMPGNAGSPVAAPVSFNPMLLDPWVGFAVFAGEVAVVLLAGYLVLRRRDA